MFGQSQLVDHKPTVNRSCTEEGVMYHLKECVHGNVSKNTISAAGAKNQSEAVKERMAQIGMRSG
jgi:hypothetical protein